MYSKGLVPLAVASVVAITTALTLVFFYAPLDADQGFVQKIFYIHVPMAIVALGGFVAGGIFGIRHLRSGDSSWDLRSYVAIHLSIILGLGVLATGAIWAKASWGHWWVWDEPVLVSRVLSQTGGDLPGEMRLTFLVALAAMTLLFVTLWKFELTAKHASIQLKRLRRRRAERSEAVAA
jgi:ABC-type transport system involved in cytochrome c biogenesis permease subunit